MVVNVVGVSLNICRRNKIKEKVNLVNVLKRKNCTGQSSERKGVQTGGKYNSVVE